MHVLGHDGLQVDTEAGHFVLPQDLQICTQQCPAKLEGASNPSSFTVNISSQRAPALAVLGSFLWVPSHAQLGHLLSEGNLLVRRTPLVIPHLRLPHNLELVKVVDVEGEVIPGGRQRAHRRGVAHSDHLPRVQLSSFGKGLKAILDEVHNIVPPHGGRPHSGVSSLGVPIMECCSAGFAVEYEVSSPSIPRAVHMEAVFLVFSTAQNHFIIMKV